MILVALLIGAILIVAAFRNTQGALFSALGTDVPKFVVWAAAIIALGAIGFVPGLKPVSRGLMTLVLVVIILRNYQGILKGFQTITAVPNVTTNSSNSSSSASTPSSVSTNGSAHTGIVTMMPMDYGNSFSGAGVGH